LRLRVPRPERERTFFIVVFQVEMHEGRQGEYFDAAAALRPELQKIDGFLSVERFESLSTSGRFLSLSFWRDAAAIAAWRRHAEHQAAQARGKNGIFADFRISVAEVVRDYRLADRVRDVTAPHPAEDAGAPS
jgi:heme-degrading monooxygenase HmoA